MQYKLFVALQLEAAHHFIERCAGECSRRSEPPATFGATKTPKTLLFNPHQFSAHGRLCRCVAFAARPHAWYPLCVEGLSGFAIGRSLYICRVEWSVGHPTYVEDLSSCEPPFRASVELGELLKCWSRLVRLEAVSIAQYQGRIQHSFDRSSRGGSH